MWTRLNSKSDFSETYSKNYPSNPALYWHYSGHCNSDILGSSYPSERTQSLVYCFPLLSFSTQSLTALYIVTFYSAALTHKHLGKMRGDMIYVPYCFWLPERLQLPETLCALSSESKQGFCTTIYHSLSLGPNLSFSHQGKKKAFQALNFSSCSTNVDQKVIFFHP